MMLWLAPRAQDGVTALMKASNKGQLEVVQALLAKGADKNAKDEVSDWLWG